MDGAVATARFAWVDGDEEDGVSRVNFAIDETVGEVDKAAEGDEEADAEEGDVDESDEHGEVVDVMSFQSTGDGVRDVLRGASISGGGKRGEGGGTAGSDGDRRLVPARRSATQ